MMFNENISKVIEDEKNQVNREWKRFIIFSIIIVFLLFIIVVSLTSLDEYLIFYQIDSLKCTSDTIYININEKIFYISK